MRHIKKLIRILELILIIMLTSGCMTTALNSENGENIMNSEIFNFPGGGFVNEYKYIERDLYLKNFCEVKIGMTNKDIIQIIGEPNGLVGSGIQRPFYQLTDGSCIVLYFAKIDSDKYSKLVDIRIIDLSGRAFILNQN